ncbi:MAG: hypothetical protein AAF850_10230 [Pseudomonadota bacterium]
MGHRGKRFALVLAATASVAMASPVCAASPAEIASEKAADFVETVLNGVANALKRIPLFRASDDTPTPSFSAANPNPRDPKRASEGEQVEASVYFSDCEDLGAKEPSDAAEQRRPALAAGEELLLFAF